MPTQYAQLPLKDLSLPSDRHVDVWLARPGDMALPADAATGRHARTRLQRQFLLRLLLGAYLGRPGRDVQVMYDGRGKPGLAPPLTASGLRFSLSHSGDWLLVAVARGMALGVDLEIARARPKALAIARRYFSAHEARWLEQQADPERAFVRLWTAKEAVVKAAGSGLAGYLDRVEIASGHTLAALPDAWPAPDQWSLLPLQLPDGLHGHLAVMKPRVDYTLFELQP